MMVLREIYDFVFFDFEKFRTIQMSFEDGDFPGVEIFFIGDLINDFIEIQD